MGVGAIRLDEMKTQQFTFCRRTPFVRKSAPLEDLSVLSSETSLLVVNRKNTPGVSLGTEQRETLHTQSRWQLEHYLSLFHDFTIAKVILMESELIREPGFQAVFRINRLKLSGIPCLGKFWP